MKLEEMGLKELTKTTNGYKFNGDLILTDQENIILPPNLIINGDLSINNSKIIFSKNLKINGNLYCNSDSIKKIPIDIKCEYMFLEKTITNVSIIFKEGINLGIIYIEPNTNKIVLPYEFFKGTKEQALRFVKNSDEFYIEDDGNLKEKLTTDEYRVIYENGIKNILQLLPIKARIGKTRINF